MHIPGEVLDPAALVLTGVAAAGAVAVAAGTMRRERSRPRLAWALAGGAAVLVAHLAEVSLVAGQTVHLVGAALLAIALGPRLAILTMTAALLVETLVWDPGGILALGADVLVMAVVAVLTAWVVNRGTLAWAQERSGDAALSVGWRSLAAALSGAVSAVVASVAAVGLLAVGAAAGDAGAAARDAGAAALGALDGSALAVLVPAHLGWAVLEAALTAGGVALAVAWRRSRARAAARADVHRHVHVLDGDMDRLG